MSDGGKPPSDVKCTGEASESRACDMGECFAEDGWTEWSDFTPCSKTCDTGYQVKRRYCQLPKAKRVDGKCDGPTEEYKYCRIRNC